MQKDKEFYESVGYYSAMAQMLSFVVEDKNDGIDDYILAFELREKHFKLYLDSEDYSAITNELKHMNENAKKMWLS